MLLRTLVLVACSLMVATAHAQWRPSTLMLRSDPLGQVAEPRDPQLRLAAPDPELFKRLRRNRVILSAGVGIMASSLAHLAVLGSGSCNNESRASIGAAGILGVAGLAFTLGGSAGVIRTKRLYDAPMTTGQKVGAVLTALGTAIGTQALLMTVWALQGAGACAS